MSGEFRQSRRRVLLSASTVAVGGFAGCSNVPFVGTTLSWGAAFIEGTSEQDRAILRETPVVVDQITSKRRVQTAVTVLGWHMGVEDLSSTALTDVENVAETARSLQQLLTDASDPLDRGLTLVDEMKDTSALGVSVWDVATRTAPKLALFEDVARRLHTELDKRAEQASVVAASSSKVSTQSSALRSPSMANYNELIAGFETAIGEYESISQEIATIQEDVRTVTAIGEQVRNAATDIPELGEEAASVFGAIFDVFDQMNTELESFQNGVSAVRTPLAQTRSSAAETANNRYRTISAKAVGSSSTIDILTIETDTPAYDESQKAASKTGKSQGSGSSRTTTGRDESDATARRTQSNVATAEIERILSEHQTDVRIPFDDGIKDVSANERPVETHGGEIVTGRVGKGLKVTPPEDYITVQTGLETPADPSQAQPFSYMTWIKLHSHDMRHDLFTNYGDRRQLYISSGGSVCGRMWGGGGSIEGDSKCGGKVPLEEWHHIGFVFTGSSGQVYLDGQRVAEGSWNGYSGGSETCIGSEDHGSAGCAVKLAKMDATIDEWTIIRGAVPAETVRALAEV